MGVAARRLNDTMCSSRISVAASEIPVRLAGSITHLGAADRGAHVVTGSHGGKVVADYALAAGVRSLICHDAGVGLDNAGIAALSILDRYGIPAAAISHQSARIGDAEDLWNRGRVSHSNGAASALGVTPGLACAAAAECLASAVLETSEIGTNLPAVDAVRRHELGLLTSPIFDSPVEVVCLDSASEISADDAGKVVLTGSHGGLPSGSTANAIKADIRLAAFNDAGIGVDDAGVARLAALDERYVPAFVVSSMSARIGDGLSTYETGVVSRVNRAAEGLGIKVGDKVRDLLKSPAENPAHPTPSRVAR